MINPKDFEHLKDNDFCVVTNGSFFWLVQPTDVAAFIQKVDDSLCPPYVYKTKGFKFVPPRGNFPNEKLSLLWGCLS